MAKTRTLKFDGAQALLPFRTSRGRRGLTSLTHASIAAGNPQRPGISMPPFDEHQTNLFHPLLHKGHRAQTLNRSRAFCSSPARFWQDAFSHIELQDARYCQKFLDESIASGAKVPAGVPHITVREANLQNCPPQTRRGMVQVSLPVGSLAYPKHPLGNPHFSFCNGEFVFESTPQEQRINLSKNPSLDDLTTLLETLKSLPYVSTVEVRQTHGEGSFVKTIFYTYRGVELVPFASSTKSWKIIGHESDLDFIDFSLMHPDGTNFASLIFIVSGANDAARVSEFLENGVLTDTARKLTLESNDFAKPMNPADPYARERDYLAYLAINPND